MGGDLRVVANEVDKLATYAGPGQAIDVADVEALVSQASEASIFACVDAVAQGDRRTALSSLAELLEEGEKPERVLALVGRQVRLLLQAKDLTMRGEDQEAIGRALGVPPFPCARCSIRCACSRWRPWRGCCGASWRRTSRSRRGSWSRAWRWSC